MLLNDVVIDMKLSPIGESPRNSPVIPAMPKLRAMLKTVSSIRSILFFFLKSMLTKQLPGITNKKIMLNV